MLSTNVDWSLARCRGSDRDVFYADDDATIQLAKSVCWLCPIRVDCLTAALDRREPYGVWGGLTEKERRKTTFARHRVHCPGCGSRDTESGQSHAEICLSCGLSWPV